MVIILLIIETLIFVICGVRLQIKIMQIWQETEQWKVLLTPTHHSDKHIIDYNSSEKWLHILVRPSLIYIWQNIDEIILFSFDQSFH